MRAFIYEVSPVNEMCAVILGQHFLGPSVMTHFEGDICLFAEQQQHWLDYVHYSLDCGPLSSASRAEKYACSAFLESEGSLTCSSNWKAVMWAAVHLGVHIRLNPKLSYSWETTGNTDLDNKALLVRMLSSVAPVNTVSIDSQLLSAMMGERYFLTSSPVRRVEEHMDDEWVLGAPLLADVVFPAHNGWSVVLDESVAKIRRLISGFYRESMTPNYSVLGDDYWMITRDSSRQSNAPQ